MFRTLHMGGKIVTSESLSSLKDWFYRFCRANAWHLYGSYYFQKKDGYYQLLPYDRYFKCFDLDKLADFIQSIMHQGFYWIKAWDDKGKLEGYLIRPNKIWKLENVVLISGDKDIYILDVFEEVATSFANREIKVPLDEFEG